MRDLLDIDLRTDPAARSYQKTETVAVEFAAAAGSVQSRVGPNHYEVGDALVTGMDGDTWSVSRERFDGAYEPVPPALHGEAGPYRSRTRPVLARRMAEAFRVARRTGGDDLMGQAGDWLLQYAPGEHGIAQEARFNLVYRLLEASEAAPARVPIGLLDSAPARPVVAAAARVCANCGTPGGDKYCGHCGQRLDTHLHSLPHFIGEATEVITHADSRVWSTLLPLVTRPGFLTREFFAGRRARYLQPFRLYLILSVLFLLLASLLAHDTNTVQLGATPDKVRGCDKINFDVRGWHWLEPRLLIACQKITTQGTHALGQSLLHNLGRAMFLFLPLLAGLMTLLYWRPRRFYLEHLLLLLHNHAFVFLWMSVYLLATHWLEPSGWNTLITLLMGLYLTRYLYRSMVVVYAQRRALTAFKFIVLCLAYLVGLIIMLLATALFSAVTL